MSKFISVSRHPMQTWHTVAAQHERSSQGLVMAGHPPHKKKTGHRVLSIHVCWCCIKSMIKIIFTFQESENELAAYTREEICSRIYKNLTDEAAEESSRSETHE